MKNTYKVAVTGGIGSGKSAVLDILTALNYPCISSDAIVKELYNKKSFLRKIKKNFPSVCSGVLNIKVDKKALSNIVFLDKSSLEKLNNLTHPAVMKEIEIFFNHTNSKVAFAEVPLLFEGNFQDRFDRIIVVKRMLEDRIESVKKRSNLTREEILARVNDQVDYDALDLTNYIVIENYGEKKALEEKIKEIIENIVKY